MPYPLLVMTILMYALSTILLIELYLLNLFYLKHNLNQRRSVVSFPAVGFLLSLFCVNIAACFTVTADGYGHCIN